MGRIKSAIEIALERTEAVKGDKAGVELYEAKRDGKKLAGAFLEAPEEQPLEPALKKIPKEKIAAVRRGAADVLLSQISLPYAKEDLARLAVVGKGLDTIVGDRKFIALFGQLQQVLERYLSELEQFDKAIRQQYAPKLKQKEEDMARRTGRKVQLDPMQDPEFAAFYNQNMGTLKDRYQAAIEQVRAEANAIIGE